jgi:phosphotransferase system HPr (HPr) family protein
MISKNLVINCKEGFHLRPAQVLMEKVTPLESCILIKTSDGEEADAKSLLGLMSLGLEKGSEVVVEISGPDENKAMDAVEELFHNNFGE